VIELKAQGRRVYYLDINELDETATGFEPFPSRLEEWATILQKGDVLIVDEVQRFLPAIVRRDGAPAWIEALTRNRHLGIDLIFITQHPKLLDSFVRRLVNKHEHVLNVFGRQEANLYTWVQVCEEPESKSQRNMADVRRWKYPDALFGLYKSAELHTRKAHQPRMVKVGKFALIAGVLFALIAIGLLWRMYHSPKAGGARSAPPQSTSSSLMSPKVGHSGASDERPELTTAQ
jgi:zona occludens toxin (predicted ATPase)